MENQRPKRKALSQRDVEAVEYSVLFVNNSLNLGSACMYQEDPDIGDPGVMSLAWFAKVAAPTTKIAFTWSIDYDFVWAETGQLTPGVVFSASQTRSANLSTTNEIGFTFEEGAYFFTEQTPGATEGTLYIQQSETIPTVNLASVGIGMSGFGTFVVQAQPNLQATFTPKPTYWITFGNYTQGEVLDIGLITDSAEIQFPAGVYAMTAILNEDNTWTVEPTSAVNALFLEAKQEDPEAVWGQLTPHQRARLRRAA